MKRIRVALRLLAPSAWYLLVCTVPWIPPASAVPVADHNSHSEDRRFLILRNGSEIGTHVVSFHRDADRLIVESDLNIRVQVFFVTLYTYRQSSREVWSDGRLVRFAVRTLDDGRTSMVRGHATRSGFSVIGDDGPHAAPADIVPATYWNPDTIKQTRLLDPTTGEVYEVAFTDQGVEPVKTAGGIERLRKYTMVGGDQITLWYDSEHRLARARHLADEDGSLIEFRLAPRAAGRAAAVD